MFYPVNPTEFKGKQDVAYWEGFLSDEEINLILSLPEWFSVSGAAVGDPSAMAVNEQIRRSDVSWLNPRPEVAAIYEKLGQVVSEVNRQFFGFDLSGFYEPAQLTYYNGAQNGHYDWHVDSGPSITPRKLSMSLLLSNPSEFEGGEFQVKTVNNEEQTLETVRGRAWFFPSYTLHRVAPVTKGVRRSLVLWVGGPAFK